MPTYKAKHKKSDNYLEFFCSIKEMEQWEKDNPEWEILPGTPGIHSGWLKGESKSDGWNDVLRKIKKSNPGSTVKLTK